MSRMMCLYVLYHKVQSLHVPASKHVRKATVLLSVETAEKTTIALQNSHNLLFSVHLQRKELLTQSHHLCFEVEGHIVTFL